MTTVDVLSERDRLRGTLGPLRRRILEALREPGSATTVAARLGETRQRVNYHLRELEKGGLVELVELRPRRGVTERVLRATAGAVVLAPEVVGDLGAAGQDRFAADTLLAMAARTLQDVAAMRERAGAAGKRLVTFAVEADVGFAEPADIERFASRLAAAVADLAAEFAPPAGADPARRYRLTIGGHPAAPAPPTTTPQESAS
ncbi:ArsR/SmtB family transcription factor [Spirilliplanes yamanashiensis]|uniref:ArsR/SmtB family transcription factor n=1 Tax=Spirilliplanes yamanashiensis TaxID=42233 RepID=UPI00194E0C0A|nr:helix-turn-helix domain-containing protein [Spirilliplanes yamanashiensis]MDP9816193.1 DNA-binding transcriptional ArsR family regulator [Spirilliplanes yamanashiensis]